MINAAQQMIRRYVIFEIERIVQPVLIAAALSHHAEVLPLPLSTKTLKKQQGSRVFQQNLPGRVGRPFLIPDLQIWRSSHSKRAPSAGRIR